MVESANKLVVEFRLKGSGMHWARKHVDPMVARRTTLCSERWEEAWGQFEQELRRQAQEQAGVRRCQRQAQRAAEAQETTTLPQASQATTAAVADAAPQPEGPSSATPAIVKPR